MVLDLDGSGMLESVELMSMGSVSWRRGGKAGEWTDSKNSCLLDSMDTDGQPQLNTAAAQLQCSIQLQYSSSAQFPYSTAEQC